MGLSIPGYPDLPEDAVHEVSAFVLPQARLDFAALTKLLAEQARAHDAEVATHSWPGVVDQVAAYADDWMVEASFQEGDDVLADLRDMAADCYAQHPRAAEMATCRCRVDVWVFDPDVSVAAFDCLDTARECLKAQLGVIVIHPETGESLSPGALPRE
jgi:hypothetical protein